MKEDRAVASEGALNGPSTLWGTLGALWGLGGVMLLLGSAVYRLTPVAIAAFDFPFVWYHWLALIANLIFMAVSEGYRGFQQGFSPRVAARAKYLRECPQPLLVLLAPLFCMGYFHATRKRKITSIALTAGIIILIVLVRMISQPWRGIIDAGVVLGLAWGIVALLAFVFQAWSSDHFSYAPEVPNKENNGSAA